MPGLSLNLGLGLTTRSSPSAQYDPAAAAYFAAMTVQPDAARRDLISNFFAAIRSAGVLPKLSHLYLMAAHDSQAARLNAVSPGTNNLSAFNSPTFTVDRGYQGDGSASYLATNYVPPAGTQDAFALGLWSRTNSANGGSLSGDFGNDRATISRDATSSQMTARVCSSVGLAIPAAIVYPGYLTWSRNAPTAWRGYKTGANQGGTRTDASAVPTAVQLYVCRNGLGLGVNQLAAAHIGGSLLDADVLALYNALNSYLTAIGAA